MSSAERQDGVFELRLFGTFDARVDERPLPPLRSRKEQWLLALLALRHDRDVPRDWLAAQFWPDNDESQGLFYLRKALSNLRNALGAQSSRLLSPTARTVRLDLAGAFCDVVVFDTATAIRPSAEDHEARLLEAVTLYRGPLLADCPESWATTEREARGQTYLAALEALAAIAIGRGEAAAATRWLRLAIAAEPYRESAACALMQALAISGDRAAMQQVYHELRQRLRSDLNSSPSPETDALFKRLSQQAATPLPPAAPNPDDSSAPVSGRHLPVPLTDLIGRGREIAEVTGWLERRRLVTLLGPGGVGKTRLSIAAADAALPGFKDGVWFVDLAPQAAGSSVAEATLRVLGVQQEAGETAEEGLVRELSTRALLLVLDNCEHVLDSSAALAHRLLTACSDLRILATSRQALGVTGEQVYSVPTLALPSSTEVDGRFELLALEKSANFLMDYAGIQLFVQRALNANPSFRLDRRNAQAVCQICLHLDGIPLAIELAAARVRSLTADDINAKLDQRFRLLTGGSRAALPRQQTLRSLIDWSYDLLNEAEKALLCRVSVFSGGWTLTAAEAVCSGDPVDSWDTLDLLTSLVDKSLIEAETQGTNVRYRLLETVREYAHDRLRESGDDSGWRERHLDYFLALALEASPHLRGSDAQAWLGRLDAEHDNFRLALAASGDREMRLAVALYRFWMIRGHFAEGRARYDALLKHRSDSPASKELAHTLNAAGNLAYLHSDFAAARELYLRAAAMKGELGDRAGEAGTRINLASVLQEEEDFHAAREQFERSLAIQREHGDREAVCVCLTCLGNVCELMGEGVAAPPYFLEAIGICRELGDRAGEANALHNLASSYQSIGDTAASRDTYLEALALNRELGVKMGEATNLAGLGTLSLNEGNLTEADRIFSESLSLLVGLGARRYIAHCLIEYARLDAKRDAPVRAARLLGAAETCLDGIAAKRSEARQRAKALATELSATLGEASFTAEFAHGRSLTAEQAAAVALGGGGG